MCSVVCPVRLDEGNGIEHVVSDVFWGGQAHVVFDTETETETHRPTQTDPDRSRRRQTQTDAERQTDTERQTSQPGRQADRQTDRHPDRPRQTIDIVRVFFRVSCPNRRTPCGRLHARSAVNRSAQRLCRLRACSKGVCSLKVLLFGTGSSNVLFYLYTVVEAFVE